MDVILQVPAMGCDHAPGPDADGRTLRGVRARQFRRRGGRGRRGGRRGVREGRGRRGRGGAGLQLHARAVQPPAPRARRLLGPRLLRAAPARAGGVAGLRRRAGQAHLQRGVRGPAVGRARDAVGRHPLPSVLRQERGRLVRGSRFDR